jgi:hypothetical protein
MIDVAQIIREEIERLELQVQQATALYNQAMIGLEVLRSLTDRMREAAERDEQKKPYSLAREEAETATGD